jgi:large-conductance mechanosensitive channel
MNPANISFENPNDTQMDYPMSVPKEQTQEQTQEQSQEQSNSNRINIDKPNTSEAFKFLNINANTILTLAIAVAIGFSLKDFMNSLVYNIIQPLLMKTIMYFDTNNVLPVTQGLREKGVTIDISKFLGNILVIKLVIGSMYILYTYADYLL